MSSSLIDHLSITVITGLYGGDGMEIVAIIVNFFLDLLKPQKETHEIRIEFLNLRNLLLKPLKNSRGLLVFFIDEYNDTARNGKGYFYISPLMTISSEYSDDSLNKILLSHKLAPKQIDFVMNFFHEVHCITTEYERIDEKSKNLMNETISVLRLPDYEPVVLKLDDTVEDYLDSYFVTTCMFADRYYQQEKETFISILTIIDRITRFKTEDKSALTNEYQTTVATYNRIKGDSEYLI